MVWFLVPCQGRSHIGLCVACGFVLDLSLSGQLLGEADYKAGLGVAGESPSRKSCAPTKASLY